MSRMHSKSDNFVLELKEYVLSKIETFLDIEYSIFVSIILKVIDIKL